VYTLDGTTWSPEAELYGTDVVNQGQQSYSVSISDDGTTVVSGGPVDNGNRGAVWVFVKESGEWFQQGSKLTALNGNGTDTNFGYSVSISSDGNTIAIGSPQDDYGIGAAYIVS